MVALRFRIKSPLQSGFTLVELSIVLVIVGLIIGGVLVGRDLISAAGIRAQISQIEKYNAAVNTFRGKYGYLPGDIPDPTATQYGFVARGTNPGQGDGNGTIQGDNTGSVAGFLQASEALVFWNDLSVAGLIGGSFTGCANASCVMGSVTYTTSPNFDALYPKAQIGNGNYVYVDSGGTWDSYHTAESDNYFSVSVPVSLVTHALTSNPGLTVQQAYSIDSKIDDGLPQSGRVQAFYINWGSNNSAMAWAAGVGSGSGGANHFQGAGSYCGLNIATFAFLPLGLCGTDDNNDGVTANAYTCYDVASGNKMPVTYSVGGNASPNNSSIANCALSFKFQ